ncbi:MAG: ammonia channel protein, partial [Desulfovibrio sp.]
VGGLLGTLCLGVFASLAVNPGGADGLLQGNAAFLGSQALGVGVVLVYTLVVSFILLKLINLVSPLRLSDHAEQVGMDTAEHNESAYQS